MEIRQALENKANSVPRGVSEFCYPNTVDTISFLGGPPSMEQPELVMKFLTLLGVVRPVSD